MFASPSFYLAHKISPSLPSKRIYEGIYSLYCYAVLCYELLYTHKVRDYVCAAGKSRNVESLGADNKKKRREKKTKFEKRKTTTLLRSHSRKAINSGTQKKIEGRLGRRSYPH